MVSSGSPASREKNVGNSVGFKLSPKALEIHEGLYTEGSSNQLYLTKVLVLSDLNK